ASLDLGTTSQQVGVLTLAGGVLSGGTLTATAFNITSGTINGNIAGSGTITKTGDGTFTLTSENQQFTGDIFINSGTLQLGNGGSKTATLGGTNAANAGRLVNNGVLAFKFQPGTQITLFNVISGSGAIQYLPADGFTRSQRGRLN
ncbi:MAG: hypothetical protein EBR81_16480, partial [Proteobacteria bacterium]|nr:hypothetical protein [Pseudomonadota bacterium]